MQSPDVGSEWMYSPRHYPYEDIPIEVRSSGDVVTARVTDGEFLNELVRLATNHQREFQDWENTLEVYPFVQRDGDRVCKAPFTLFTSVEDFYMQVERQS